MPKNVRGLLPAIGFVILVWAIWGQARQETLLRVYGGLGEPAENALLSAGFECLHEGPILTVKGESRDECVEVLLRALTAKSVEESAILENIGNIGARPYSAGDAYRRKIVFYRNDGSVKGWMEDQSDFNWVYDPSDFDSVKSGPKTGYLAKPNVNPVQEETHLLLVRAEKERLEEAIRQLDPSLIIGQIKASWREYPQLFPVGNFPTLVENDTQTATKLQNMSHFDLSDIKGLDLTSVPPVHTAVVPLAQNKINSEGQTCVAMCLNALTGSEFTDKDIDQHYGFRLLEALQKESREAGYTWRDAGNLSSDSWKLIDKKVNEENLPVIVALNGPEFSPSGQGQIVTIVHTTLDTVTYADPADGQLKTTQKQNMVDAPSHPDGNFIFVADRTQP